MKTLSIGLVIDGLAGGGAERVVLTLAAAFADLGHQVTLVSLRSELAYPLPQGVDYLLVEDSYRGPLRRLTEVRRRARQLDRVLRQRFGAQPFDLVLSNLPKTDRIVSATPCLQHAWFCLHGAVARTQLANKHGLKRWIKQRQLRQTYNGRKLVAVAAGLAQDIQLTAQVRPQTIKVIYNPVDISRVRQLSLDACPLEHEDFIVHIGRFHPVKRHDRLLQAFKASHYAGKLVLLGSGPLEASIREMAIELGISDRVVFSGFQANPYCFLRVAKALILSSDHEGLPLVLVEALACGTQVVSTRYYPHGPEEILRGPMAQHICAPDPVDLARTIDQALQHPLPIQDTDLELFRLEQVVNQYLSLASPSP